jgi:predicted RNase H-like HicB family nuclease
MRADRALEEGGMLTRYLRAAMHRATYKILPDDGTYYGELPGFQGVWANASRLEDCRDELEEVLEEWILLSIHKNLPLPNPHQSDVGTGLLTEILQQAGITRDEWEQV